MYLIAYNPRAKKYLSYSVHNILEFYDADNQCRVAPAFDLEKFEMERFAVIDGKIEHIKLTIKKEITQYFENRLWHATQKISYDI